MAEIYTGTRMQRDVIPAGCRNRRDAAQMTQKEGGKCYLYFLRVTHHCDVVIGDVITSPCCVMICGEAVVFYGCIKSG